MTPGHLPADLAGTWIRTAPAVELISLAQSGDGYSASIDRPAAGRFREPIEAQMTPAARRRPISAGGSAR
jgi:hypothetical protein